MAGLLVDSVILGSIADELEVTVGDRLLTINNQPLRDLIDYSYYTASAEDLLLEIEKPNGELWDLEIERDNGEPLGLIFSPVKPARCANNCLFCFVHQLPKGLRKSLYIKDEDYRLSFLNGNYVTLANLRASELERIIKQRLSPLYISVHATNSELRERLLGKSGLPDILTQLQQLAAARIVMHTQVVLCPDLNDAEELQRTITDLASLYPAVQSVAVVPLGLTAHRQQLPRLTPVDTMFAQKFISVWQPRADTLRKKLRQPFLFLADEFYLKAALPFPPLKTYGDFPQIENGVGMVPLFVKDAAHVLKRTRPLGTFRVTVITGVSSFGFVSDFMVELAEKSGVDIVTLAIENKLFGSSITVTGLIVGNDIAETMIGHDIGTCLFVPDVMLKEGEGIFLDNMSLMELQQRISCPIVTFDSTPNGFYKALKEYGQQATSIKGKV